MFAGLFFVAIVENPTCALQHKAKQTSPSSAFH